MRNARLAERMLSLVTTPERASATVGDLLEDRAHAGAVRFWSALLLTAGSLLWRDMVANPKPMTRLAVYGVFLQLLLSFVTSAAVVVVYAIGAIVGSAIDPGPQWKWGPGMPLGLITVGTIAGFAFGLVAQFQIGRVLAKRSPGNELAPCIATTLLAIAIPLLIVVLSGGRAKFPTGQLMREALYGGSLVLTFLSQVLALFVLLAGAARIRRQQLPVSR